MNQTTEQTHSHPKTEILQQFCLPLVLKLAVPLVAA